MKLISWNVNGIRASIKKGFRAKFAEIDADIFCIQETKMQEGQEEISFEGYYEYWNSAVKKGYSGTLIYTKEKPMSFTRGIGIEEHDNEGRVITLEYDDFYLVNVYTPNAKRELERLDYRMVWEDDFREYLLELNKKKSVIICGDLNVAQKEIDVKNFKSNIGNAGLTDEERGKFNQLLESGFVDTYRYFYPDKADKYSWFSYFGKARENNTGWRIDYFLVSKDFTEKLVNADILDQVYGSDHVPVELTITKD
ncbi:MAG: exodeoxyribonuclease III [Lachnospirales bacterium]